MKYSFFKKLKPQKGNITIELVYPIPYMIISKTKTREFFSVEALVVLLSYRIHSGHLCMLFLVSCVFNPPLPAPHQKNL